MTKPLLELTGISKSFPGVKALQGVEFTLNRGEVLVLVGENGAGKSTLMKILSGIYQRDEGTILVDGEQVEIPGPSAAQALGISIIHQEMNLMPDLTVAQNIFIGREPGVAGIINERALNKKASRAADQPRHQHRPQDPRRRPHRRRPADGRDRQGALVRLACADHGRAHECPHRQRGRDALRADREPSREGHRHRLHLAPHGRAEATCRPRRRAA